MEKKYQYSKFLGENREEQIVIRCDNWEEFKEAATNIGVTVDKIAKAESSFDNSDGAMETGREFEHPSEPVQRKSIPLEQFEKHCERCGAKKVLNPKTGKWFCEKKCWLKNQ